MNHIYYFIFCLFIIFTIYTLITQKYKYKFGNIIGTFEGVTSYSNQNDETNNKTSNYYNGVYTGVKWQCVEFVRRYLIIRHGITFSNVEHAFQIPESPFSTLNGTPVQMNNELKIGSVIVWPKNYEHNSPHGHVAIVSNIDISGINVVEQNYDDTDFPRFIPFTNLQNIIILGIPELYKE